MHQHHQNSTKILNSLGPPGLRQVPPGNLPQHNTSSEERIVPLLFAVGQFDLEENRRSAPLFQVGHVNPTANATTHSHQDDCIEDNAFEPRPIHPAIHNKHFSRTNNDSMRLMQCDTYPPLNHFGLCGGASDLLPSYSASPYTASSPTARETIVLALEGVKEYESTWLDLGKPRRGQISDREAALRRCSSSWTTESTAAASHIIASPSNCNNTMPCSGDCQGGMVDMFAGSEAIDTTVVTTTIPTSSYTNWGSINLDDQNNMRSRWLRDIVQGDPAILNKTTTTEIQRLEKSGLHHDLSKDDTLFVREPSKMIRSGVPGKCDPQSLPKPVRDKSLLPQLRDYVSPISRPWTASGGLRGRYAALSLLQARLSPVPISPAQEARMIAEVPGNQSINLLEQRPWSSPKKTTTSNKAVLSKEESSAAIPTFNQKAPPQTVEEQDDAQAASPLPPKDVNPKHGVHEKPKLNLISSKRMPMTGGLLRRVSVGTELLVKAGTVSLPRDSKNKNWQLECALLRNDQESLKYVHEDVTIEHLKKLMLKSDETQLKLQEWDTLHGLPKSHSQTMVSTSRSRRQLREGIIIPKWDGTPLINDETELGKPKKRQRKEKHQNEPSRKSCKSHSTRRRVKIISQQGRNLDTG